MFGSVFFGCFLPVATSGMLCFVLAAFISKYFLRRYLGINFCFYPGSFFSLMSFAIFSGMFFEVVSIRLGILISSGRSIRVR